MAIILGEIIFGIIILMSNIVCPFCGLTRSVISLLHFDIISSIKYNCFGIFLVTFLVIYNLILILDIIFKTKYETKLYTLVKKTLFSNNRTFCNVLYCGFIYMKNCHHFVDSFFINTKSIFLSKILLNL